MDYTTILRYFRGEATSDETKQIFKWLEESPENREELARLKKVWALAANNNDNTDFLWKENVYPEIKKYKNKEMLFLRLKQAAIFLLLIGAGSVLHYLVSRTNADGNQVYQGEYSVESPPGQMTSVDLPDGSNILLNSGSSVTYSADFSKGKREVTLEGEAFFDVVTDSERPFFVRSSLMDIKVYGTSFNIQVYPDDKFISATLIEGSISILNKNGDELKRLIPGENMYYSPEKTKLKVSKVDTELYCSWRSGLITFRNEKLKDIARRIERWYNVEIEIRNQNLGEELYFGTILKNKPVDQIMEVLQLTTSLEYSIIPRADKPTLIYWD